MQIPEKDQENEARKAPKIRATYRVQGGAESPCAGITLRVQAHTELALRVIRASQCAPARRNGFSEGSDPSGNGLSRADSRNSSCEHICVPNHTLETQQAPRTVKLES